MQRVANYKDLAHWVLVQTTAPYAHGVRALGIDSSRFDGCTCSTTYCDHKYTYLANSLVKLQRKMLAKEERKLNLLRYI